MILKQDSRTCYCRWLGKIWELPVWRASWNSRMFLFSIPYSCFILFAEMDSTGWRARLRRRVGGQCESGKKNSYPIEISLGDFFEFFSPKVNEDSMVKCKFMKWEDLVKSQIFLKAVLLFYENCCGEKL